MKKFYKNIIQTNDIYNPQNRVKEYMQEVIERNAYIPQPLSYEDIDSEFKKWVDEELELIQEGEKLPTMVLYSNQRFAEYSQTWRYTDEHNNIRLNFKTITRETNPYHGTIMGDFFNVPGNMYYTFKQIDAIDESGREYILKYKMKQPTAVDLNYKIGIISNKYTTINDFNELINRKFNAKQCYIQTKGHYISLLLEHIDDESEYNIDDRQFFSQIFSIKARGYIIKEDDIIVEECPKTMIISYEGDRDKRKKSTVELSEYEPCIVDEKEIYIKEIDINVDISYCAPSNGKVKFVIDEDFIITGIEFLDDYIEQETITLIVNDKLITNNLKQEAYEGYSKLDKNPDDITENNTLTVQELPSEHMEDFKYILFEDSYYIWHQLMFKYGDEIKIITERTNRYNKSTSFILHGYNIIELPTTL